VKSFFESAFSIPKLPQTIVRHLVLHMFNRVLKSLRSFFASFLSFLAAVRFLRSFFIWIPFFSCRHQVYSFIFPPVCFLVLFSTCFHFLTPEQSSRPTLYSEISLPLYL